ncbi:MAG: SDR family NAD(P)-dependent oxidoreductase [Inquilinaceae bacterium]
MTTPANGCAWITGASSGIGRALALKLAGQGWTVVASARGAEALDALTREASGTVHAAPCDVTELDQVRAVVAAIRRDHGPIALAVLNAGTFKPDDVRHFDAQQIGSVIDVNLMGTVHCVDALLPDWIERRQGHLAVVSSVAGYRGLPTSVSYGATKAALINMCEALKFDFDRLGLVCQVINPGFVRTPLTDKNDFPMPFLMEVEDAVDRIVDGLGSRRFEITFPRRFAYMLKLMRCLPYGLYFPLVRRATRK